MLRDFWREVYRAADATLEDLYPHRLLAAWRICRMTARVMGWIEGTGVSLADAAHMTPCPWREDVSPFHPPDTVSLALVEASGGSLTLLPPADPARAVGYARWVTHVARLLDLARTQRGRYGLRGLLDPEDLSAWPGEREVLEYEALVVREALRRVTTEGMDAAEDFLRDRFGLHEPEVRDVMAMTRRLAAERVDLDDVEGARATYLLSMEQAIDLARAAADHRAMITGLEKLAKIRGLFQEMADSDDLEEMVAGVRKVSKGGDAVRKRLKGGG